MNFLGLRSNQTAASEQPPAQEIPVETNHDSKLATTLEGLIAEDPFPETTSEARNGDSENGTFMGSGVKDNSPIDGNHLDVTDDEGWIAIPYSMPLFLIIYLGCLVCDSGVMHRSLYRLLLHENVVSCANPCSSMLK